ncbi:hypothetical protein [Mumia sp. DW29H23]|uniref:hypothetical protein n=1 Tax=Mumia sp. DW29H23 TaxID=3421241 RepID=UPI003D6860D0
MVTDREALEEARTRFLSELDHWKAGQRSGIEIVAALAAHDREVREATKKGIAEAIEARVNAESYGTTSGIAWVGGWQSATSEHARIARGWEPAGGASHG